MFVAGAGRAAVSRKQGRSLDDMASESIGAALRSARLGAEVPTGLYVGNMMSGILSSQQHLGPLVARAAGMVGVDAATAEACCGAGGAALRWGAMSVAAGWHRTVVVAGIEAMTHAPTATVTTALATASHWPTEGAEGETFVSLNGALMAKFDFISALFNPRPPFLSSSSSSSSSSFSSLSFYFSLRRHVRSGQTISFI